MMEIKHASRSPRVNTELVRQVVQETLTGLGFDVTEPNELQADMHYLRAMRKGSEDMRKIVKHSLLTVLVSTGLYMLWEAAKSLMQR